MLSDNKIKNLKPRKTPYPSADGNGLTIYTLPSGTKSWRLRYRFNGKADTLTLGKYPYLSLKEARKLKDEYLGVLESGVDPKAFRRQQNTALQQRVTFKQAFDRWYEKRKGDWSPRTATKNLRAFEIHMFPYIGDSYVDELKTKDLLEVFQIMDSKGISDTLKKVKNWSSRVFRECVLMELIEYDPTSLLSKDDFSKAKTKNYAYVAEPSDIRELLAVIKKYKNRGAYSVAEALNMAPYIFLRPSELTGLKWEDVDFGLSLIRIKGEKMKMGREHLVPLSDYVCEKFKQIHAVNGRNCYVFPSPVNISKPICSESLRRALRNLGVSKERFTTHGFRAMASTRLNEMGFGSDVVEKQLSHLEPNKSKRAYNHATYLDERRKMMDCWSNFLNNLIDS